MTSELGFKELYEVSIKATLPIEVGGNTIETGETIAFFDKIQIANFQEIKDYISSKGGFGNQSLITWETTKEMRLSFTQGVFSKIQLSLMSNAQLIDDLGSETILVHTREVHESNENGQFSLRHKPKLPIFIYDQATGKKIQNWTSAGEVVNLEVPFKGVLVEYQYEYDNGFLIFRVGQRLTHGFLSLVGKMRIKDGATGKVVTGIIKIPKLRLMSDLSIRVGSDAIPQLGKLDAIAIPEGERGQQKVMDIIFLNDDIDADM